MNVIVTWKYTSPRQYKLQGYTFKSEERFNKWFTYQCKDHGLRKIINFKII